MRVAKLYQDTSRRLGRFLFVTPVYAYQTPIGDVDICGILDKVIDLLFGLAVLVAIAWIIMGGIAYVTSGGDKMAVNSAKDKITSGTVGLVIALAAWFILNFVIVRMIGGFLPECAMPF